jgi:site-specific recombinase XerD
MFLSVQEPYPPLTYNAVWKRLRYRLNDSHVHPHALRHTAATELLNLLPGAAAQNLQTLRITLGHKHTSTTQRYLHSGIAETVVAHLEARSRPLEPAHPVLAETFGADELALLADIRNEPGDTE